MGKHCCFCEQPLIPEVCLKHQIHDVVGFTKDQVFGDHDGEDYGPFNTAHHGKEPADLALFDKVFCHTCAQALWWELEDSQMAMGGIQLKSLEDIFDEDGELVLESSNV